MINQNDWAHLRDNAQREIVYEAVRANNAADSIVLQNPLELGLINFWESNELILFKGVDTTYGRLFDTENRIIRYLDIPTVLLLKIHHLIVNQKAYEYQK
jgi:hypothetical protein